MMPREKWTDDRLDDLNKKVDDGFARLDRDNRELRNDIKDLKGEINDVKRDINRTIYGAVAAVLLAQLGSSAFF